MEIVWLCLLQKQSFQPTAAYSACNEYYRACCTLITYVPNMFDIWLNVTVFPMSIYCMLIIQVAYFMGILALSASNYSSHRLIHCFVYCSLLYKQVKTCQIPRSNLMVRALGGSYNHIIIYMLCGKKQICLNPKYPPHIL